MQRAAEISPLIHGRTIGPDIVLLDYSQKEEEQLDNFSKENNNLADKKEKMTKNEINKKKTTPANEQEQQIPKSPIIETLVREPNSLYVSKCR